MGPYTVTVWYSIERKYEYNSITLFEALSHAEYSKCIGALFTTIQYKDGKFIKLWCR